jgi:hypothetical protein
MQQVISNPIKCTVVSLIILSVPLKFRNNAQHHSTNPIPTI